MSNYRHPLTGHGEGCLCRRCDEVAVTISRTEYSQLLAEAARQMPPLITDPDFYMARDALWDVEKCAWCQSAPLTARCPNACQVEA